MEKLIDVIIPAYKAQDTIAKTLASLAMQSMADQLKVTIVNDCDGIGYKWYVDLFNKLLDIEEVTLKENGGPGVARQKGLDHTKLPYVMFIDADDTLTGPYAISTMYQQTVKDEKTVVSVGTFYEVTQTGDYVKHNGDMVWMFAKMYKRDFLLKYDIRFNDTRANEDTGFNTIVRLCSNDDELINFYDTLVYYWNFKEDSITRINDFEYTYNQSFVGYVLNQIYAIQHVQTIKPDSEHLNMWVMNVMGEIYIQYLKINARDNRFSQQALYYAQKYFREIILKFEDEEFMQTKGLKMIASVIARNGEQMPDIIPELTFYQFISILENNDITLDK